ncbi:MAG TPA: multiple cyclophane-containing RiPP AmcA [Micromonosporaceae bacterium]|nr:multiple cyclophane-containing RiPP AmcA [Micromonosporaceae bacterium]
MPETTNRLRPDAAGGGRIDQVADRVLATRAGLALLLREAEDARRDRAEAAAGDGASAVCAWNHFENIPTFYNWNNRPR